MTRRSTTGDPTEYTLTDEGEVEAALDRAGLDSAPGATRMTVSARIEWAGVEDRARGGHRTTRLDGLNLGPVREALLRAKSAGIDAGSARPSTSRQASGWHAQLRELTESAYGRGPASDRAGLAPTGRTLRSWLAGDRAPSRANQERIAEAYGHLRNRRVEQAQARLSGARHEAAQALSQALRDRYGAEIRLRDITRLELE